MSAEFSLAWDDHHQTLVGFFERLLDTNTLVDCTIAAEGMYLKAHKIILSACSPYFELLFSQENEKNPIVVLKDIKFQELKAIITFIYRGNVKVPEERLGDFVDAAESLQVKGLGRYNIQKMSTQDNEGEGPFYQRIGCMSPLIHKSLRTNDFDDGVYRTDRSVVNFQSKHVEGPSYESDIDAPTSCQDERNLTLCSATNSPASLSSSVCSEMNNLEASESVSFVNTPSLQYEEVLPNPDSVVVKSECVAMEEVDIPEMDYYTEPKEEQISEVVQEGTEEDTNSEASNQFPAFSMVAQTTSTRLETIFVTEVVETTNSLGAVPGLASAASSSTPSSAAAGASSAVRRQGALAQGRSSSVPDDRGAPPPPAGGPCSPPSSPVREKRSPDRQQCNVCGKRFPTPESLSAHHRTHTGDRRFACELCGKTYTARSSLKNHRLSHTGVRPFACDVCGKTFSRKSNLIVHSRIHTGDKPYACEICGKKFPRRVDLRDHRLDHTGKRPYSCELCGKSFKRMFNLVVHRRIHSGDRPYACGICDKKFMRMSDLRDHRPYHTGKQPYQCEVCSVKFMHMSNLRRHRRIHTRDAP